MLPASAVAAGAAGRDAGQDLEQRRLAGAVLAHQRVDATGREPQRHALEGAGAAEALRDAGGDEVQGPGTWRAVRQGRGGGGAARRPRAGYWLYLISKEAAFASGLYTREWALKS